MERARVLLSNIELRRWTVCIHTICECSMGMCYSCYVSYMCVCVRYGISWLERSVYACLASVRVYMCACKRHKHRLLSRIDHEVGYEWHRTTMNVIESRSIWTCTSTKNRESVYSILYEWEINNNYFLRSLSHRNKKSYSIISQLAIFFFVWRS